MNVKTIQRALEDIEQSDDDREEINNAIAIIRFELRKLPALDPEKFFAIKFEEGKDYIIFVEHGSVDAATLQTLPAPDINYGSTFVFVHPDGHPVADKFLVCDKGSKVFADSRYVDEVEGVTLVWTGGMELGEVVKTWKP